MKKENKYKKINNNINLVNNFIIDQKIKEKKENFDIYIKKNFLTMR